MLKPQKFSGGPVVKILFSLPRAQIWYLVTELRFHKHLMQRPRTPQKKMLNSLTVNFKISPFSSFYFWHLCYESESSSVVSDSLRPHGLYSPWNSPGQNTGVSSLSLLQGIFPTQGSNPGLPHYRWILYQLSHLRCEVHIYLELLYFLMNQHLYQYVPFYFIFYFYFFFSMSLFILGDIP